MPLIYHIATAEDWAEAQRVGAYTTSTRGRSLAEQGFIHASTEHQVEPVANLIYTGLTDLLVLVIDPDRVTSEIKHEAVPGWEEPFPHIYGRLNADAVIEVRPLATSADGAFTFAA